MEPNIKLVKENEDMKATKGKGNNDGKVNRRDFVTHSITAGKVSNKELLSTQTG